MVHLEQHQLMLQTVFALAERVNPTFYRGYALPDVQVEPLDKGRIHLPAAGSQDLLEGAAPSGRSASAGLSGSVSNVDIDGNNLL